jgi:hypothetical protein
MKTHRFEVNVPNPTTGRTDVLLRLEPIPLRDLRVLKLDLPRTEIAVLRAGISMDPCEAGEPELQLRLRPYSSVDVYIEVETADPRNPEEGGAAAMQIVDVRDGERVGGVLLVCLDRTEGPQPGQEIPAKKPTPIEFAKPPYFVALGADPAKRHARWEPETERLTLVAPLTNPGRRKVTGVMAYLEHLGNSGAMFSPATWNIGTLGPDEVFFANWTVELLGARSPVEPSIIVQSSGRDLTRIHASIRRLVPRGDDEKRAPARRRAAQR